MSHERIFIPQTSLYEAAGSDAISKFGDRKGRNLVIVPESHLLELDRSNRSGGPTALAAKDALLYIHNISRQSGQYDRESGFSDPVSIGDTLDISFTEHASNTPEDLEAIVARTQEHYGGVKPTIITPEPSTATMLRLRGIPVERPDFLIVESKIVEHGMIEGTPELHAALFEHKGSVNIEHAHELLGLDPMGAGETLIANQFISLEGNDGKPTYAKVRPKVRENAEGFVFERGRNVELVELKHRHNLSVLGIKPLDSEQFLALEHILLNEDIGLGFVTGSQGSGKTLLTYVAAVDGILKRSGEDWKNNHRFVGKSAKDMIGRSYEQIVLFKSNDVMGGSNRDPGALPGDLWQKINQFMQSYIDAHKETPELSNFAFEQMLMNPSFEDSLGKRDKDVTTRRDKLRLPEEHPAIELAYSAYVRGRTFIDSYIIIDEAQNFTPYEVKTLIERAGKGSKVIITGDPLQVDNPRCSVEINGLTAAMRHFMDKPYVASLNLSNNYRSQSSSDSRKWKVF